MKQRVNTSVPKSSYQETFTDHRGKRMEPCAPTQGNWSSCGPEGPLPRSWTAKMRSMYGEDIADPEFRRDKNSAAFVRESYRPQIKAYNPLNHLPFARETGAAPAPSRPSSAPPRPHRTERGRGPE